MDEAIGIVKLVTAILTLASAIAKPTSESKTKGNNDESGSKDEGR